MKYLIYILLLILVNGCGTLGGWDNCAFPISFSKLDAAINRLYDEYPNYKMPEKWKDYDNWSQGGYDFLESRIFYFGSVPEEMYYITFLGDSKELKSADTRNTVIAVRA